MEKRKLRLDELAVDTFETTTATGQRGTVMGQESRGIFESCGCVSDEFQSCPRTCGNHTCYGTCDNSCNGTCGCATGGAFTCDPAASCDPNATCAGCTAYMAAC